MGSDAHAVPGESDRAADADEAAVLHATDYDRDDVAELVDDLAAALDLARPHRATVVWRDDGPHVAVRADHLCLLIEAVPSAGVTGPVRPR